MQSDSFDIEYVSVEPTRYRRNDETTQPDRASGSTMELLNKYRSPSWTTPVVNVRQHAILARIGNHEFMNDGYACGKIERKI
jgi:hypothetical protein